MERRNRLAHHELFTRLDARFDPDLDEIDLSPDGIPAVVHGFDFTSAPELHRTPDLGVLSSTLRALVSFFLENNPFSRRHFSRELESPDRDVAENRFFRYTVFAPKRAPGFDRAILLLHGLNEKSWSKYLPWAARLVELTGRPVILFPIAFHMNRTPQAWANPREMMGVHRERARLFPNLVAGSFANAALSHRVHFAPHRFLTSGLETYLNLVELVREIRDGGHRLFGRGAGVDILGYSIGASLAELLLLADRDGLFAGSRAFLFCGGSILDRANPVSRAIMDDEAYRAVVGFLERFVTDPKGAIPIESDEIDGLQREIEIVRRTVFAGRGREDRESSMQSIGARIHALVLERDRVFHPDGMLDSWSTADGGGLFGIEVDDPPYEYSHEQPFPPRGADPDAVDASFQETMKLAAAWLTRGERSGLSLATG